jgi:hypothetical protein
MVLTGVSLTSLRPSSGECGSFTRVTLSPATTLNTSTIDDRAVEEEIKRIAAVQLDVPGVGSSRTGLLDELAALLTSTPHGHEDRWSSRSKAPRAISTDEIAGSGPFDVLASLRSEFETRQAVIRGDSSRGVSRCLQLSAAHDVSPGSSHRRATNPPGWDKSLVRARVAICSRRECKVAEEADEGGQHLPPLVAEYLVEREETPVNRWKRRKTRGDPVGCGTLRG